MNACRLKNFFSKFSEKVFQHRFASFIWAGVLLLILTSFLLSGSLPGAAGDDATEKSQETELTKPQETESTGEPIEIYQDIRINEFMSSNSSTIIDEDGDYPDWIELYNHGQSTVSLQDYYLSDNSERPLKWTLPAVDIKPGEYILIFASGKDRIDVESGFAHANFRISQSGEKLILTDKQENIVDWIDPVFLNPDISYGRDPEYPARWLYFPDATPGEANMTEGFSSLDFFEKGAKLEITELMSMNTNTLRDGDGDFPAWIEIYNAGAEAVGLQDYTLSDTYDELSRWLFPDIEIKSGEYLVVFASGKNRVDVQTGMLHTNFSISAVGEPIILSDPLGHVIDEVPPQRLYADVSFGRDLQSGSWLVYDKPTPGLPNAQEGFVGYTNPPYISVPSGFYENEVFVELTTDYADADLYYTLDGSFPTNNSILYTGPIRVDTTTVLRAVSVRENYLVGSAATESFFISVTHTLPVVSVALAPRDFDHPVYGIYSLGLGASDVFPYFGANFHRDVEVPATFQLFEPDGRLGFGMDIGFKIFGGWTRAYDQKSFAIYARNYYEHDVMTYPFMDNKENIHYKHLVLRTSGQDVFRSKIRDIMMTSLIENTGMDYQGHRQVILYINGKYWGIYNLREKINRYFFHYNHGIENLDSVDILEGNSRVKAGSADHYLELMDFIVRNDLGQMENYEYVKTVIDVQSFMDYNIMQMYTANNDTGNIRYWRERSEEGKWRWIIFDMDLGFGPIFDVTHDSVWFMINPAGTGHGNYFDTRLIRNLLKNEEFRSEFIARFAWHMHNTFHTDQVIALIDRLTANIEPEIEMNTERWPRPESYSFWLEEVEYLRDFARRRPAIILEHLKRHLELTSEEEALFP